MSNYEVVLRDLIQHFGVMQEKMDKMSKTIEQQGEVIQRQNQMIERQQKELIEREREKETSLQEQKPSHSIFDENVPIVDVWNYVEALL